LKQENTRKRNTETQNTKKPHKIILEKDKGDCSRRVSLNNTNEKPRAVEATHSEKEDQKDTNI